MNLRVGRWELSIQPRPIHGPGYDPDHPLVACNGCGEEYTACELGNHYCPSCGESAEGAPEVSCDGCPCIEQGGSPCCWCGRETAAHIAEVRA